MRHDPGEDTPRELSCEEHPSTTYRRVQKLKRHVRGRHVPEVGNVPQCKEHCGHKDGTVDRASTVYMPWEDFIKQTVEESGKQEVLGKWRHEPAADSTAAKRPGGVRINDGRQKDWQQADADDLQATSLPLTERQTTPKREPDAEQKRH